MIVSGKNLWSEISRWHGEKMLSQCNCPKILSQIDSERFSNTAFDSIVDYAKDDTALTKKNRFIVTKCGRRKLRTSWQLSPLYRRRQTEILLTCTESTLRLIKTNIITHHSQADNRGMKVAEVAKLFQTKYSLKLLKFLIKRLLFIVKKTS